jgi:hypothetical protein
VTSIDFWFRMENVQSSPSPTLVAKDMNGFSTGDFQINLYEDENDAGLYRLKLRLQTQEGEFYAPEPPLFLDSDSLDRIPVPRQNRNGLPYAALAAPSLQTYR